MVRVSYLSLFCNCQRPMSPGRLRWECQVGSPRKLAELPRQGVGVYGANHVHVARYSCRVSRHRVIRDPGQLFSCLEHRQERTRSHLRSQILQIPMVEVGREYGGTRTA
jgi:hypothetical protein